MGHPSEFMVPTSDNRMQAAENCPLKRTQYVNTEHNSDYKDEWESYTKARKFAPYP